MGSTNQQAGDDHESRIAVLENQMERVLGNGQPGDIEKTRTWVSLELKEIHNRITGVKDAISVKTWLPLVVSFLAVAAAWAAVLKGK